MTERKIGGVTTAKNEPKQAKAQLAKTGKAILQLMSNVKRY